MPEKMSIEMTKEQIENLKVLLDKIIFQGGYQQVKSEIIALEEIANILNAPEKEKTNGKENNRQ